jgi:heat shock protein HtpX
LVFFQAICGHHGIVRNTIKTTFILTLLAALFVGIGALFGGKEGLIIGLLFGLIFTGGSYWFSDTIAIKAARAVPVSEAQMPDYYAVVRDLTTRAGMPMPKLYVTPDAQPNAFATGRNPDHAAVAVTQGILQICTWDEMRGVLAHEISHVGNRDILIASVAATIAMAITLLARMAAWAGIFFGGRDNQNGNIFEILALVILAPLAATLLQLALSRSREYEADRSGARLIGDGEPLARALAKLEAGARQIPMPQVHREMAPLYIVSPLAGMNVSFKGLFSDHPPTAERIKRLRSMEWAR